MLIYSTSRSYVLDVIAAVAFGIKTNCQKSNADPFLRQATVISKAITNSPWLLVFGNYIVLCYCFISYKLYYCHEGILLYKVYVDLCSSHLHIDIYLN